MPRLIIADSGGVERTIKRLIIADSGGTPREIQRLFVIDSGGNPRLVFVPVKLSGETIAAVRFNDVATAAVRIGNDGKMYRIVNGGAPEQIDAAADWLRGGNPAAYQARYINVVGDAPATFPSGVSESEWHPLSSGSLTIQNADTTFNDGPDVSSFDIQIRKGTGPVLATGAYSLRPDSNTF